MAVIAGLMLAFTLAAAVNKTEAAWSDSPLLHNALRFACSTPGWDNQTDCEDPAKGNGVWSLDRKYAGGWGTPGTQYGSIQCSTCHIKDSTNIKRVAPTITAETGSFPGSTVSFSTAADGSSDFGDDNPAHTTSTRVCETCHSNTSYHNYDSSAQTVSNHYNQADCIKCHTHKTGFRADCTSCHGNPPEAADQLTAALDPTESTGSATYGAHIKHAAEMGFECVTCHNGWEATGEMPNSGNLNLGFNLLSNAQFAGSTATLDGGTYFGRSTGSGYTPDANTSITTDDTLTCAVYCHGANTPQWTATTGTVVCGSCHGQVGGYADNRDGAPDGNIDAAAQGGKTLGGALAGTIVGKHANHLDNSTALTGTACGLCHAAGEGHVGGAINGRVEVSLNTGAAGASATFTAGSCSNLSCHGDAQWDSAATADCTFCHGNPPTSGAHAAHTSVTSNDLTEDLSDCASCHSGADSYGYAASGLHQNGVVEVDAAGYVGGTQTCANACHNTTAGLAATWTATALTCDSCHGIDATGQPGGKHSKHISKGYNCNTCHVEVPTDTSHITVETGITDGEKLASHAEALPDEANLVVITWDDTNNTCANTACHNPSGDASVADWDISTSSCTLCHSATDPASGSHTQHMTAGTNFGLTVACNSCHLDPAADTAHLNASVDFIPSVSFNPADNTCSALACHNNGTGSAPVANPAWGTPAPDCTICHAGPPATGDHAGHWVSARTSLGLGCLSCHTGTAASDTVASGAAHIDGTTAVTAGGSYNSSGVTISYSSGAPASCTASCHSVNPKNWASPTSCNGCHNNPPTSGAHAAHTSVTAQDLSEDLSDCAACHAGADTYGYAPSGLHQNGSVEVTAAGYASGSETCASACHTTAAGQAATWTATSLSCDSCHGVDATGQPGGKHSKHIAAGYVCTTCHDSAPSAGDTSHISPGTGTEGVILAGRAEALASEATVSEASWNSTARTCSNTACHNPSGGYAVNWDTDTSSCALCHSNSDPGTGSHTQHLAASVSTTFGITLNCSSCHTNNGSNTAHLNGTIGFIGGISFSASSCTTTSCHSNGAGSAVPTPSWGRAASSGDDCSICHSDVPTTAAHGVHLSAVGIHAQDIYSGTSGLLGVGSSGNVAHGDGNSTTISCNVCHNDTVDTADIAQNATCASCHGGSAAALNPLALKSGTSTHLNNSVDIRFPAAFKSKAQVRNDITTVTELNSNWSRSSYKQDGTSFDTSTSTPAFAAGTCSTVACHNGNSVNWNDPVSGSCLSCHTALPQ
jgi:predicted CxxxxCH...CXXCH cytochrome family protein